MSEAKNKYPLSEQIVDVFGHPLIFGNVSTATTHLLEEFLLFKTPLKDLFTNTSGITPWQFAEKSFETYLLFIVGIPALAGLGCGILRHRQLRRSRLLNEQE